MRLVFFAGVVPTSPTFFRRVCLVAKYLGKKGCSVKILCLSQSYYSGKREESPPGFDIEFVGQYHHDQKFRRLHPIFYLPELFRIALRSLRAITLFRPGVVHIFTAHPSSLFLLVLLRIFGYKACIDLDDLNSAQAQAAGYSQMAVKIYSFLESIVPGMAFKITVCSHFLLKKYPGAVLLPNMYDREEISRLPVGKGREGKWTVVVYMGMMGHYHGEKKIIKMIPHVLRQEKHVRFLFIGWGEGEGETRTLARRLNVQRHVRFTGRLPYRSAMKRLASCHIGLLPMEDAPLFRARHPLKMIDYMAAGVCCIASDVGEAGHFIKDGVSGVLCSPGNNKGLAQKIVELVRHPKIRKKIGRKGRHAVSVLEVRRHIKKWEDLYRQQ